MSPVPDTMMREMRIGDIVCVKHAIQEGAA